jgi:hypothetical protein
MFHLSPTASVISIFWNKDFSDLGTTCDKHMCGLYDFMLCFTSHARF